MTTEDDEFLNGGFVPGGLNINLESPGYIVPPSTEGYKRIVEQLPDGAVTLEIVKKIIEKLRSEDEQTTDQ